MEVAQTLNYNFGSKIMKKYIVSNRKSRTKITIEWEDECLMGEWVDIYFVKTLRDGKIVDVTKFYDGYEARQFANNRAFA
jgi:hypothetical protein